MKASQVRLINAPIKAIPIKPTEPSSITTSTELTLKDCTFDPSKSFQNKEKAISAQNKLFETLKNSKVQTKNLDNDDALDSLLDE